MSVLFELYSIYKRFYRGVVIFMFWLYNRGKKRVVPTTRNEILLHSGVSLARQIKDRKLKCLEVVESFITRIKEVNPLINALVDERFDEAITEAKEIDKKLDEGSYSKDDLEKLVFLGVPFTTKESTNCKGLSATFGLVCRRGFKANEDADVVTLMKESGAILLGVCNVPEVNMWGETYNPIFGKTRNPYDTTRNAGGSTGGDAALIAALGTPIAVGTDIAGSIRAPSARCGIFGHKPTNDIISTKGLTYRDGKEGPTLVTAGPMAKKVEDLLPMLKVLARNDPKLNLDNPAVDLKKIKLIYTTSIECYLNGPITKDSRDAVMKCVNYFEENFDIKPKNVKIKSLDHALKLWFYCKTKEKGTFQEDIKNQQEKASLLKEVSKYLTGRREHTLYTLFVLFKLATAPHLGEDERKRMEAMIEFAKVELMQNLGDNGVLILPSEPCQAGYHYSTLLEPTVLGFYSLFSIVKFPVTQVPIGFNSERIPVGVQVVSTPFNDKLTLAVARELEKAFGGYKQPLSN